MGDLKQAAPKVAEDLRRAGEVILNAVSFGATDQFMQSRHQAAMRTTKERLLKAILSIQNDLNLAQQFIDQKGRWTMDKLSDLMGRNPTSAIARGVSSAINDTRRLIAEAEAQVAPLQGKLNQAMIAQQMLDTASRSEDVNAALDFTKGVIGE
jgi:DNA-binding PucR family transcriptional regulator